MENVRIKKTESDIHPTLIGLDNFYIKSIQYAWLT